MQDARQLHNANILHEAMKQQNVIAKSHSAASAIQALLALEPEEYFEPKDSIALRNILEVLGKLNTEDVRKTLSKKLQ
jgi:hypothetical protein